MAFTFIPFADRTVDASIDEDLVDALFDRDEALRELPFFLPLTEVSETSSSFVINQNWFIRIPLCAQILHIIINAKVAGGITGTYRGRIDNTLFSDTPDPYADLGQIACGDKPGRESDDERNIAINLGLALDDMATAILVYRKAIEMDAGTLLAQ